MVIIGKLTLLLIIWRSGSEILFLEGISSITLDQSEIAASSLSTTEIAAVSCSLCSNDVHLSSLKDRL